MDAYLLLIFRHLGKIVQTIAYQKRSYIRFFPFDSDVNFESKERTACKGKLAISGKL